MSKNDSKDNFRLILKNLLKAKRSISKQFDG